MSSHGFSEIIHENYHYDFEGTYFEEMFYNILTFCFLSSVEGLHAIVVSDRDGVPVIKGKMEQLHASVLFAFE